ncbi:hypothetical protein ES703_80891 [subsurface metagenome]
MNRRINTRVVAPNGVAAATLIDKDASEVYWLTVAPNVFLTPGVVQIYDGFDAGGILKWEVQPGQSRHYNFIPPIHCEQGVFVYSDGDVGVYTIAWRPKKWDRPKPHPQDVITPPKEE